MMNLMVKRTLLKVRLQLDTQVIDIYIENLFIMGGTPSKIVDSLLEDTNCMSNFFFIYFRLTRVLSLLTILLPMIWKFGGYAYSGKLLNCAAKLSYSIVYTVLISIQNFQ